MQIDICTTKKYLHQKIIDAKLKYQLEKSQIDTHTPNRDLQRMITINANTAMPPRLLHLARIVQAHLPIASEINRRKHGSIVIDTPLWLVVRPLNSLVEQLLIVNNVRRLHARISRHDDLRLGVIDACRELSGGEAAKDKRVNGAEAHARQHRDYRLWQRYVIAISNRKKTIITNITITDSNSNYNMFIFPQIIVIVIIIKLKKPNYYILSLLLNVTKFFFLHYKSLLHVTKDLYLMFIL